MRSNDEGPALILSGFAERFRARGDGVLVGIASVAGDRGRGSNDVHGLAKAVFAGVDRRKDVIYMRSIRLLVMLIIRLVPERAFKRLER